MRLKFSVEVLCPPGPGPWRLAQGTSRKIMRGLFFAAVFFPAASGWIGLAAESQGGDLTSLSLEELMNIEVMSVSKTPEKSFQAPAAVSVLTAEDIRRFGATSIPEALRLVPGVEVARINANQWAVSARGFGGRLARATLVLIDGRSVYTPLFAGTYWEIQDMPLEDIDRIEVIRGPGAAVWGANAVNGVINIVTKNAQDTQGGLLTAGGGTEERGFGTLRYGGKAGENLNYRFYGKYFDRDHAEYLNGNDFDDWRMGQAGFRTDWEGSENNALTFQGNVYDGRAGQRAVNTVYTSFPFREIVYDDVEFSGGHVLGRWTHAAGPSSRMALQTYYDRTKREDLGFQETRDTGDLDFQHSLGLPGRQTLTYGLGYRVTTGKMDGTPSVVAASPGRRTDDLWSSFLQDEIALVERKLSLTLGSKVEHNDYSGWEVQPSGRLAWTPTPQQTVWTAVSRAVRAPSRVEHDIELTGVLSADDTSFLRLVGNEDFDSEELIAYELGYKARPWQTVFFDIAGFYNDYDKMGGVKFGSPLTETDPPPSRTVLPLFFENSIQAKTYGGELQSHWDVRKGWQLRAAYSYLRMNLKARPGSADTSTERATEGGSPRHQFILRSLLDMPGNVQIDPTARYVSGLPAQAVPAYWTMDMQVAWNVKPAWQVAVVGQNLLQNRHPEQAGGVEIERGVYGKTTWRW